VQLHADAGKLNISHTIHELRFGPAFPGQVNPLNGAAQIDRKATGIDKYFIKVVRLLLLDVHFGGRFLLGDAFFVACTRHQGSAAEPCPSPCSLPCRCQPIITVCGAASPTATNTA
jgi:hypothetical protein